MTTSSIKSSPISRHQTALRRVSCSRPIALGIADAIITAKTTVFDYGCGYGADIRYLKSRGIRAAGWDPYHLAKQKLAQSDIVNLGYVLNVIEDPGEREQTLRRAFLLANQVLIVAVRVESAFDEADEYGDGVLTRRGTFQKLYSQSEFREYLTSILHARTHVAAIGVVYIFKDEELEARYVANRVFTRRLEYRTDLIAEFKKSKLAASYVALANQLGRIPSSQEFPKYPKLIDCFGSVKRIERLTLGLVDQTAFQGSREQRREDILTYIAMLRLENIRLPAISKLPVSIQIDIKTIWKTYINALREADQFLFSIGRPDVVTKICATCPVGKQLPSHLYIHRSAEDNLPSLLRILLFAGKQIVGELDYDLVKFAKDGRAVSFLLYKDFDEDPHPRLLRSLKVYLPKATFDIRDYLSSDNPPILHRKETFVLPNYPHFEKFRALTEQEESMGLLSSKEIGYKRQWEDLLSARGLRLDAYQLLRG